MAADGEDFTRRKRLYGLSYRLSKEGRDLTEIAPALAKGLRLEFKSRPLHAMKDVCLGLENLASRVHNASNLFSGDVKFHLEAFQRELAILGAVHAAHDSTRHILNAAERLGEQIIQGNLGKSVSFDRHQACELIVGDLFSQLAVSPMEDYHAYHRHLTPEQCKEEISVIERLVAPEIRELARDVWSSPSARRRKSTDEAGAIEYSAESLESEVLAP